MKDEASALSLAFLPLHPSASLLPLPPLLDAEGCLKVERNGDKREAGG